MNCADWRRKRRSFFDNSLLTSRIVPFHNVVVDSDEFSNKVLVMENSRNDLPEDGPRRCTVCGEPIFSRAVVHPECAANQTAPREKKRRKPPLKQCSSCGHKVHVRVLVCDRCGAMF